MKRIRSIEVARLHVILCFAFDRHAVAADVDQYRGALINGADACHAIETSGTFDFFVEFDLPNIQRYDDCLRHLVEPLPSFVSRFESCFVLRRFVGSSSDAGNDLWVPCRNGLRRIDSSKLDVIRAEGDYVRLKSGSDSWLLHVTMTAMSERLAPNQFLRLHRSAIVRKSFINQLIHLGDRWIAELADGSTQRVAKSHVSGTMRAMRGVYPHRARDSSMARTIKEDPRDHAETHLSRGVGRTDTVPAS